MKKSCYAMLLLLLAALSLAIPARADEAEIERRFHDAYVLEVVEGKIADAARVYLALMGDGEVPLRLKSESRFRFAICAVLLGRADEGRAHLQALIEDEQAPAALRKRARTYLDSVAGLEIGTEIEKKLQALVFDLGRIDPGTVQIPAYRDFEIIGKRSVPFLKKLLEHSDRKLRLHAFRLLSRMDEPGMAQRWTTDIGARTGREFTAYLRIHEDESRQFEKRVMEIGGPAWQAVRYLPVGPIFSLDFARAFAATKIAPSTAVAWTGHHQLKDEGFDQLVVWMDGEDVALADAATDWLLRNGHAHAKADSVFYQRVFRRLMTRLTDEKVITSVPGLQKFGQLTARMPVNTILDALDSVLEDVLTHGGLLQDRRAATALLEPIMAAFDGQEATAEQADRYAALLMRWLDVGLRSDEALKEEGKRGRYLEVTAFVPHMKHALPLLKETRALTYVQQIFAIPGRAGDSRWSSMLPPLSSARSVRLITTAIAATPEGDGRRRLFPRLNVVRAKSPSRALTEALDLARLDLMDELSAEDLPHFLRRYHLNVGERSTVQVQRASLALIAKARTLKTRKREVVLKQLLTGGGEYVAKILTALAVRKWGGLDSLERAWMLDTALLLLQRPMSDGGARERIRDAAAAVLRLHLAEVDPSDLLILRSHRDRFPIETWLPLAPGLSAHWMRTKLRSFPAEEADQIFERMWVGSQRMNPNVMVFLRTFASQELGSAVLEQLLRSDAVEERDAALAELAAGGVSVSPEALEALVALELAADPVDLDRLRLPGRLLLTQRPSSKLFPVARALLESEHRYHVLPGISMANSLGREDLVPSLMPHLRSMDSTVRVAAKKAVAAIRAISDLQRQEPGAKK